MPASSSTAAARRGTSIERPLLGAVLCCTSIAPEDRTRLAAYAEQMGAEHKLDLTSDVTHLLVGSADTAKYQYVAREREDVKVLKPGWVEAVRQCWMEDRPLDMNALEAEYRVPTLAGLKICITGFDDLTFRAQLQRNVVINGGEYTGDLTKDVTHLIAASPEGKKYEYATLWQKKVVTIQWYKDSLDRGMQLDENCYHPTRPNEEQGMGAWNRKDKKEPNFGKRTRDEAPLAEPTRKLRRTASAKLGSQTDTMWGDIVGQTSSKSAETQDALRNVKSMSDIKGASHLMDINQQFKAQEKIEEQNVVGFLSGLYFAVANFDTRKEALVSRTIQAVGGTLLKFPTEFVSNRSINTNNAYLLVSHQTQQDEIPHLDELHFRPTLVTELWLERCMLQKAILSVTQYPLGGIIKQIVSPDIKSFTVNATGFQSIETLHISKTVAQTGAEYAETFTPKSSVLVCNSININKQKLFHAKQWGVPVVSERWLCKFLVEGLIPGFEDYSIESRHDDTENDLESELKQKRTGRDKRQPPDSDEPEQDATNRQSMSTHAPSFRSNGHATDRGAEPERSQSDKSSSQTRSRQFTGRPDTFDDTALREISPNSPSRRNKPTTSPTKKALFRTYDGGSSLTENSPREAQRDHFIDVQKMPSPKKHVQDTASINSAIEDLLDMKAKAKRNATIANEQKGNKKRLLGRALSNLSNASHGSRHSRASSVDSLNTDGIGSEIAPPSGRSNNAEVSSALQRKPSLQGKAQSKPCSVPTTLDSIYTTAPIDLSDPHHFHDEYGAEANRPQLSQLGYEESDEAIALREKLAEKRRARSRLGQNDGDPKPEVSSKEADAVKQRQLRKEKEKQVIKDDDVLQATGWGGGRRTRAKNRSADLGDLEMF